MSRLIVGRRGVRASSVEETYIGFVSWFGSSDQKVYIINVSNVVFSCAGLLMVRMKIAAIAAA